jgi:hypothetical protein
MRDNRQLLCTFDNVSGFEQTIEEIRKFYKVQNKVFVFSSVKSPKDAYITYNILHENNEFPKFRNTISIHRKKITNTLYSLNALNTLIKEETGQLDKSFVINWNLYQNSLIISGDISVRIIPLEILAIIS